MKRIIFVAILSIILAGGYLLSNHVKGDTIEKENPQGFRIETSRPSRRDFKQTLDLFGRVASQRLLPVKAPLKGRIIRVNITDESSVKKGDSLFVMGGPAIERKRQLLKSQSRHIKRYLLELKKTLRRKELALKRRLISIDEVEAVRLELLRTRRQYDEAMLRLNQLEDSLILRASSGGIFTKRTVMDGEDVERGDLLGSIIDTQHLRVIATVFPENKGPGLKGKEAVIHTQDDLTAHGRVTKVLTERTPSGGVVIWIESNEINKYLKVGEYVNGRVILKTDRASLAVPERAIVLDKDEKPHLLIRDSGGHYIKQPVQTGLFSEGWIEVISGVSDRDEVVTDGAYELFYRDFNRQFRVAD